jgi:tRNA (cytidine32/uridine32-2'-O)-methyltransferase
MFDNIRIVLVATSHPGNIGAAARAMKTMGLRHLSLVNPTEAFPNAEATARAAGADDILAQAHITQSLDEALADCQLIIGTSARLRSMPVELLDPRQCGALIQQQAPSQKIALVFGREHAGLTNEELNRCHYHVHSPSNPEFSSLNLAAAVQILCYEIRTAILNHEAPNNDNTIELASDREVQLFYTTLEERLVDLDFLKAHSPRKMIPRLKRLFNRVKLEKTEFDLLMGILTAIAKLKAAVKR